jgi:glycine cleavage system H protein
VPKVDGYDLPDDLYHHKGHMWARLEGDTMVVGLNDFAQQLAGEVSFVELPMEGDDVSQDEVIGTIETGKWVQKICAPVSGNIAEVNTELEDEATLINTDPYGDGWIFKISVAEKSELDELLRGEAAVQWLKKEIAEHAPKE